MVKILFSIFLSVFFCFNFVSAINISELAELNSSNVKANGYFGTSVSISGDYVVVGAPIEDAPLTSSGRAYVFKRNLSDDSFYQVSELNSSNPEINGNFGTSVSISGDYVVVGVPYEDAPISGSGRAYVFKRNLSDDSFYQVSELNSSHAAATGRFGDSVSISGDYVVVGAIWEDDPLSENGRAYVFKRNVSDDSFYEVAVLNSSNPLASGRFGESVSISGDYVVIGATWENAPLGNSGRAYVFKRNITDDNFYEIFQLNSSNAEASGYFGESVSISGDYVVVGATWEDAPLNQSGRAYVFKRNTSDNTFYEISQLNSSKPVEFGAFGTSVSINGDYVLVATPYEDAPLFVSGSVYVFKRNVSDDSFDLVLELNSSNAEVNGYFGNSVSISGDYIVVGAHWEDAPLSNSGRAYVFKMVADSVLSLSAIGQNLPAFGFLSLVFFFVLVYFGFGNKS
ncbi:MAG: FG-GAP repeat protein [Nanoarchaeota archaeon]|nr:FG-GAP repeat protein [Nanoarchaeota archaeon]